MTGLIEFHKSIGLEIKVAQNRVRSLLGETRHWGEEGRSKEEVLKSVLERHVPATIGVQSGFVRLRNSCTTQLDLLLVDKTKPMLFGNNGFCITTASNVRALVEVKTAVRNLTDLNEILRKLSQATKNVREMVDRNNGDTPFCMTEPWSGLFIYEPMPQGLSLSSVLDMLNAAAEKSFFKLINVVSYGPDIFIRYWPNVNKWIAYRLDELGFSYFIGNLIWQDEPYIADQSHWFALPDGKESKAEASLEFSYERSF